MYALPYDLYEQYGLRRYGAHGTSVQYLVKKASQMLQKPGNQCNLIVAHIGMPTQLRWKDHLIYRVVWSIAPSS